MFVVGGCTRLRVKERCSSLPVFFLSMEIDFQGRIIISRSWPLLAEEEVPVLTANGCSGFCSSRLRCTLASHETEGRRGCSCRLCASTAMVCDCVCDCVWFSDWDEHCSGAPNVTLRSRLLILRPGPRSRLKSRPEPVSSCKGHGNDGDVECQGCSVGRFGTALLVVC